MKKSDKELVEKFKKLEKELIEILKIKPVDIDEKMTKTEVKKEMKAYILKVKQAKKIFAEYEKTAILIESYTSKDSEDFSRGIVNLRKSKVKKGSQIKESKLDEKIANKRTGENEYVDEKTEVLGSSVLIKKKKSLKDKQRGV